VTRIDRNKALILFSVVAVVAILGSIAIPVYAADNGDKSSKGFARWINGNIRLKRCGWSRGWGRFVFMDVSEEFGENVIGIAESDEDVQDLLDDDYSVAGLRPVIKAVVDADGDVVAKATSAIVMLEKDTTSHASAWVDLEEGKVTRIVILTRTVIEKS